MARSPHQHMGTKEELGAFLPLCWRRPLMLAGHTLAFHTRPVIALMSVTSMTFADSCSAKHHATSHIVFLSHLCWTTYKLEFDV